MKYYHLTVTSKTKKSLKSFLIFLNSPTINANIIKKYFKRKKRKTIFTILKSPHVYKTAQEQFEFRFFSKRITVYSNNIFHSLIFLKKIKNNLFPDIKIKIKIPVNKKQSQKTEKKLFNPYNFKLNILKTSSQKYQIKKYQKQKHKKVEHLLKIFDLYGETCNL